MKRFGLLLAIMLAATIAGSSQAQVGAKIESFSLPDMDGKTQSLADIKGTNGAVLIFVSAECPVVRGYNERLNELAKAYKAKGINVVGIDSNVTEPPSEVKAHA